MSVWDNPYIAKKGKFRDSLERGGPNGTSGRNYDYLHTGKIRVDDPWRDGWKASGDSYRTGTGHPICPKCGRPKTISSQFCGECR